mmetsp:Transcript_82224/g.183663  ORF Transcript_82224/g.183663 Transcript_82224/m.183663 type:complete len:219 (+) Transcript_82224:266-922(+)
MARVVVEGVLGTRQEREPVDAPGLAATAHTKRIHLLIEAVHELWTSRRLGPLLVELGLPVLPATTLVALTSQHGEQDLIHAAVVCPRPLPSPAASPPALEEVGALLGDLQEKDSVVQRQRVVREDDRGILGGLQEGFQRSLRTHDVGVHIVPEDVVAHASVALPLLNDLLPHHLQRLQLAVAEVATPTVWPEVRATQRILVEDLPSVAPVLGVGLLRG